MNVRPGAVSKYRVINESGTADFTRLLYRFGARGGLFFVRCVMDKRLFKRGNFLFRTFSFKGYISVSAFWSDLPIRLISLFCAVILMCIAVSVCVPGEVEEIVTLCQWIVPVLALLWLIPVIPLTRRRLRDAGYTAKAYLWLLLPVIGWIIFIIKLCAKSVPRKSGELWFE